MIDGLKTTKAGFDAYMAKRAEEDAKARPGRSGSPWLGMNGRRVSQGECRVVQQATRGEMTLEEAREKLKQLQDGYDPVRDRGEYRMLMNRIRQLERA